MEESIKRVEKLVHATNSALAQMKYSLMFDDLSEGFELGGEKLRKKGSGPKFFVEEDLRLCQEEFKSEADDMLAKMDKLFGSKDISYRKHSKTLEKIKEINKKLTIQKSGPLETQQSRQKLLTLISQDVTPTSKSSEDKPPALKLEKPPTPKKSDTKSPAKPKEELKTKIFETQEIVDRGFQTARQLSQKVENMSKKAPNESDTKKSDSSETLKSRCEKCAERRRMKKMKEEKKIREVKEDNVRVIEVKNERMPSLGIQRLPSLHIKDGLRLQKVHELEIPGSDTWETVNTGNVILNHEAIEKEKREKEVNQVLINRLFSDDKFNYVECFNCGKLNKTRETRVDPRKIDDVLRMCNFNIFDPRIDEFVERCNMGECVLEEEPTQEKSIEQSVIEKSHRKTRKLQEMSEYLSKLYKQEAEALEDNHLRLDNILQSLFKRVDESREVFEECLLKRRGQSLSVTKPVTITFDSMPKMMDKSEIKTQSPKEMKPVAPPEPNNVEKFLPNPSRTETFEKREQDKKESPKSSSSPDEAKPPKPMRKSASSIGNVSRLPKRIFKKSGKALPKAKIQKTTKVSSSVVKLQEKEEKSPLTTSSGTVLKEIRTIPQIKRFQTLNNFEPIKMFSKVAETEKNNKTQEIHVTSLEEQSPPKPNEFTLDPSFEKPELLTTETHDLKAETERSPSSTSSGILKNQTSPKTEKSEDYESDFEGDSEPEVNHKLSTILEGDSEPEKKQMTTSQGTTPTELVSSLKEILSALKDQFTRTETLAEKLTENMQERRESPKLWPTDSELVINLQSARKDSKETRLFKSPFSLVQSSRNRVSDDLSMGSLSEGGSSIGEIIARRKSENTFSENLANGRRSSRVPIRNNIPFELGLNEDVSYSEGEIPSNIVIDSETNSAHSVGEVLSDKTSKASNIN